MITEDSKLLSTRDTARRFGVSMRSVDRWLAAGLLPKPIRINGRKYFRLADLEAFEAARAQTSEAA